MNVNSIKQKIAKAISKAPTVINLYRHEKISDGMGGYTVSEEPTLVTTQNGLLDNSKNGFILPVLIDSGTIRRQKTNTLILVYDSSFTVLKDDFFTVNEIKYKVNNADNILNLNICWDCDLEVIT